MAATSCSRPTKLVSEIGGAPSRFRSGNGLRCVCWIGFRSEGVESTTAGSFDACDNGALIIRRLTPRVNAALR